MMRNKNKIMNLFRDFLKIGLGLERLLFVTLLSIIMVHIVACFWVKFHNSPRMMIAKRENLKEHGCIHMCKKMCKIFNYMQWPFIGQ